jgi:transposase
MLENTRFVGLDVHKERTVIACADLGGEVMEFGSVATSGPAIEGLTRKLSRSGRRLSFCYEAGPCGYGIYRQLKSLGHDCVVVAPSLIPRRPGERVKTDRRDALKLARLHRAGELTGVWVPDAAHEAIRDLVRARDAAGRALRRARQQLLGFLLRHDRRYGGKTWTKMHRRWLAGLTFAHQAQQIVLEDQITTVEAATERRRRLTEEIEALVPSWSLAPVVTALQALRGVAFIVAVTVVAEIGDLRRFNSPRQLMAYLGLVPSERSSGGAVRQGGITKTGNIMVRRVLIQAAWTYHWPAKRSPELLARQKAVSPTVRDIAWKAQTRLARRYRALVGAGKSTKIAVTAVARELAGFMWAIGREVAPVA